MPVSLAIPYEERKITRVTGSAKMRQHLNNLGFIEGEPLMVVNEIDGNVIVKLKGVTMAITHDLAMKIYV